MPKKYWIITYGCQMNFSDSERIAAVLEKIGFSPALKKEEADLIVINMCSIRQSAVDRVYGQVENFIKLKKKKGKLKTVLTGCVLKKDRKIFAQRFDYILSIQSLPDWKKFLFLEKKNNDYLKIKPKYATKFSAYVPIIIGCNNFCSYCVVPFTRGPEISRPAEEILKEAKNLIKKDYKEIWLLGENVNSYKSPRSRQSVTKIINFAKLLKMIDDIPGNFWLRFTSSHPKDFSDELIQTIATGKKITKYISLPIQSGDDDILKKMNRPYTAAQYKILIKKIRKKIPNITLSTDVIVGFPNETKKQFENTVKLFKEIKPDMAYIAQYSPRSGTAIYESKDNVSHLEKERRYRSLTEVLKKTALENNKKYVGKTLNVLPEYERKGYLIGKTKEYKTIKFKGGKNLIGTFIKIKVIDAIPWGLLGELK